MLAVSRDEKLWEQAWQRNVLLVSPSTLLFVLRTVASLWRQEQQKHNVEEIARRGAELYNKLAGFVADFTEMGKRLEQAQTSYSGRPGQAAHRAGKRDPPGRNAESPGR